MPSVPDTTTVRPIVSRQVGVLRGAVGIHQAIEELLPVAEGNDIAVDPAIVALMIAVSGKPAHGIARGACPDRLSVEARGC